MIVLLTNEFPRYAGGVATYCYELSRALTAEGNPIKVIAAQKDPEDLAFDQKQAFPIQRVPENRWAPLRHWKRYCALKNCIRSSRPSILWASDWRTGVVVSLLARRFRIPYAVTAYGTELLIAQERNQWKRIALHVLRHAQLVLSISQYTRQLLLDMGLDKQRIRVTPLGIDPDLFPPDPDGASNLARRYNLAGKKTILTLARLTPRKGQDVMIRAMPEVLKAVPSAVYVIAGRGEDEDRLRKLVADLNLESHIIFAGYVPDAEKAAYYQACDLYVMLSRREGHYVEGFGLTLLEAGVCGKPVIAGRHGGVPEVVADGKTGMLVDPNSATEVAALVTQLLSDEVLSHQMGINARDHVVQKANWQTTARLTINAMQAAAEHRCTSLTV